MYTTLPLIRKTDTILVMAVTTGRKRVVSIKGRPFRPVVLGLRECFLVLFQSGQEVGVILLIVVPDDFFHVRFFDHGIVAHEAGKNLNVVQGPRGSVLPVQEVGTDHGAKAIFVPVADGDFVVLIEHHPQIPVAAGARAVPRFLLFDKKRG